MIPRRRKTDCDVYNHPDFLPGSTSQTTLEGKKSSGRIYQSCLETLEVKEAMVARIFRPKYCRRWNYVNRFRSIRRCSFECLQIYTDLEKFKKLNNPRTHTELEKY